MSLPDGTPPRPPPSRPVAAIHAVENVALALALGIALAVPLLEMILRFAGSTGIRGASSLVTHTTLWIGMIGGMVARPADGGAGWDGRWPPGPRSAKDEDEQCEHGGDDAEAAEGKDSPIGGFADEAFLVG